MPMIQVSESTGCHRCGDSPVSVCRRGWLYCEPNCALHDEAAEYGAALGALLKGGQGGSPKALALLERIQKVTREMRPVGRAAPCADCWGPMQGGYSDGQGGYVARCSHCNGAIALGASGEGTD